MLRSIKSIESLHLEAKDGQLGVCQDFLFDDNRWCIRYMVANTGDWLVDRKVLISPLALEKPDWEQSQFPVNLTKKEIENSPPLDEDAPISRRYERDMYEYYRWPLYWNGYGLWGAYHTPAAIVNLQDLPDGFERDIEACHIRSANELIGTYNIHASDGKIGHVEDFIIEDQSWVIRFMVVDTRNWLPGRKVLISPQWIQDIIWGEKEIVVKMTREQIKNSPEYDPKEAINQDYQLTLYDYYGRPK